MLEWNEEDLALARDVGAGRHVRSHSAELALEYRIAGGSGLRLMLSIDGQRVSAWASEAEFCHWVERKLVVPTFDDIPPDLVVALANWGLAPLIEHAAGTHRLTVQGVERGACEPGFGCVFTLSQDDVSLTLRPLDWPTRTLDALAHTMTRKKTAHALPLLRIPVVAGWVRLTQGQMKTLARGDGIVLDTHAAIEQGEAWLYQHRPLAKFSAHAQGWRVTTVMEGNAMDPSTPATPGLDVAELKPDDIAFTVVAEIAAMTLSMDELKTLSTGQILDAGVDFDGRVALKVNGREVGTGRLIRIGDRLVVRVE